MALPTGEAPVLGRERRFSLFALGFRPFFLAAGISALVLMGLWLALWQGVVHTVYFNLVEWHAHEMLFGYTAAVIAGFLLTAVRNWTGMAVPTGGLLVLLSLVWLAGRMLVVTPQAPAWLVAGVDIAFLPLLGWSLWRPLWFGPNPVNRWFLVFLAGMALGNTMVHLDVAGVDPRLGLWQRGIYWMLDMVVLVLTLVAGRVIPFFTERAVEGAAPRTRRWVEVSLFVMLPLAALATLTLGPGRLSGVLWLVVGVIQLVRLAGWHRRHWGIWRWPILWVLYLGYLWLSLGLALRGLAELGLVSRPDVIHAVTLGGIGGLTLGMMSRVTLGHTGRNINDIGWWMPPAFILINLAALVRVAGPLLDMSRYNLWINLAGGLWLIAFLLFVIYYLPMWLKPRIDGRPG